MSLMARFNPGNGLDTRLYFYFLVYLLVYLFIYLFRNVHQYLLKTKITIQNRNDL